ncbi:DUF4811 domain-containing protein [Leuconostoc gelidum]|uniref:DUF4811 domain-containing protein n=1 Tax=Leuconostoc gelidum subsp. gelidum TaxID=1607839 RepID=A0AB35FZT2_LEUGE|nr:DUF4811 domain-containing protein [Leuconostoc gelidum]AFS41111.1 hypothetical protein C269_08385 [Leuconostoc gelidum JB7]MBZ5963949.1 DUF4811 domain-containing protein [Leuconostoc gelidum subsp. gelidum]MBZ5974310.1 DUF4811 domain-containing protein [Leuconostoc gelidum subsp. gelidum]MBZ5975981.1 DUF4811 domain-containing protein [Leuconostoc gelidum subsp. gelidum]MBZ5986027.1 DUF4811 domain-containing protein [Leuconostoc gelidum subsp. gelidum]
MIILIMALFAIAAFLASMTIKKSGIRYAVTLVMFAGLILSVIMVIANMHDHYGMTSVTTTTKKEIHSAGPTTQNFGMLLYQQIGTDGKENAYIYKTAAQDKKTTVAKPDLNMTTSHVNVSGNKAYKVTKTTRFVYKSNGFKLLFGVANNDGEIKHRQVIYQVPPTWVALTTEQAKSLASKLAPKSAAERTIAAQQQRQLSDLAKSNPDQAARLTVNQVKKVLQID